MNSPQHGYGPNQGGYGPAPDYAPAPPQNQGYGNQGYGNQGYQQGPPPNQGYGNQNGQGYGQPAPPQQTFTAEDFYNQKIGAGPGINTWFQQEGQTLTMTVSRPVNPATDIDVQTNPATGQPQLNGDQSPKLRMAVPITIPPMPGYEEGRAVLYIQGKARDELSRAQAEAGMTPGLPRAGDQITARMDGWKKIKNLNDARLLTFWYKPAGGTASPVAPPQDTMAPQGAPQNGQQWQGQPQSPPPDQGQGQWQGQPQGPPQSAPQGPPPDQGQGQPQGGQQWQGQPQGGQQGQWQGQPQGAPQNGQQGQWQGQPQGGQQWQGQPQGPPQGGQQWQGAPQGGQQGQWGGQPGGPAGPAPMNPEENDILNQVLGPNG